MFVTISENSINNNTTNPFTNEPKTHKDPTDTMQGGLPAPYNLKPRQKAYLTTPMKKTLLYMACLVFFGYVIYSVVPEKNQQFELSLDNDLSSQHKLAATGQLVGSANVKGDQQDAMDAARALQEKAEEEKAQF